MSPSLAYTAAWPAIAAVVWGVGVLAARLVAPLRTRRILRRAAAPKGVAAPPAPPAEHPNCRCETRPFLPLADDDKPAPKPGPQLPRPQVYRSGEGLLWEDAAPGVDGAPSVRVQGCNAIAWPRDDIARLFGLTPITNAEDPA